MRIIKTLFHSYYKIVEVDNKDNFKTLFHGYRGSRILPLGIWMDCEEKEVSDGTGKRKYLSGWHVFKDFKVCSEYLKKRFSKSRKLAIVSCEAKGLRKKEHSKSGIWLAKKIKI